jgi:integrase
MLSDLTPKHVKLIRNEVAHDYSTSMAKTAIGLISTVWRFADEHLDLDLDANPTQGVSRLHKVRKEHEPWPPEAIIAFDHAAPPNLRLALQLALFTGQRRADLVKMDWSRFDGTFIEVRRQKNRRAFVDSLSQSAARCLRDTGDRTDHHEQTRQAVHGQRFGACFSGCLAEDRDHWLFHPRAMQERERGWGRPAARTVRSWR